MNLWLEYGWNMVGRLTKKRSNHSNQVGEVGILVGILPTTKIIGMAGIQKRLEKLEENIYIL